MRAATIIFGILLGLQALVNAQQESACTQCDKIMEMIVDYHQDNYQKDRFYMKFSSLEITEEGAGEKLPVEIWKNGVHVKYETPFLSIYQDNQNQVLVLKSQELVVIRPVPALKGKDNPWENVSAAAQVDSLRNMSNLIECHENNGMGSVTFRFTDNKRTGFDKITLRYHPKKGQLLQGIYEVASPQGYRKSIYVYEKFDTRFSRSEIPGNAVKYVEEEMTAGSLKGFKVRDMRKGKI